MSNTTRNRKIILHKKTFKYTYYEAFYDENDSLNIFKI